MSIARRRTDLLSGIVVVALAIFFAWSGRGLELRGLEGIGPGYFPLLLSGVLFVLGLILLLGALRPGRAGFAASARVPAAPIPAAGDLRAAGAIPVAGDTPAAGDAATLPIPWRAIACLSGALLLFALMVRPLGLGPALAAATALSSVASRRWRVWSTVAIAAAMVLLGWVVFIRVLGMPVRMLGPLLS
ncbi:MAG: tripartite tricarboxylate transporter TctB family protein [Lautropia sp.]